MERDTTSGSIVYKCPSCMQTVPGDDWDARISGGVLSAEETTALYDKVIYNSAHDRTNQLVRKDCKDCGRDYMAQLRVGDNEVIVHTCKCGAILMGKSSIEIKKDSTQGAAQGSTQRAEAKSDAALPS